MTTFYRLDLYLDCPIDLIKNNTNYFIVNKYLDIYSTQFFKATSDEFKKTISLYTKSLETIRKNFKTICMDYYKRNLKDVDKNKLVYIDTDKYILDSVDFITNIKDDKIRLPDMVSEMKLSENIIKHAKATFGIYIVDYKTAEGLQTVWVEKTIQKHEMFLNKMCKIY